MKTKPETKYDICTRCDPVAYYNLMLGLTIFIHRINYGFDDHVYVSVNYSDVVPTTYHRLKLYHDNGDNYFKLDGRRYYISQFCRTSL